MMSLKKFKSQPVSHLGLVTPKLPLLRLDLQHIPAITTIITMTTITAITPPAILPVSLPALLLDVLSSVYLSFI